MVILSVSGGVRLSIPRQACAKKVEFTPSYVLSIVPGEDLAGTFLNSQRHSSGMAFWLRIQARKAGTVIFSERRIILGTPGEAWIHVYHER